MDEMDQQYAIVLFTNETKKGKKVIDLVPKSWLVQVDDKNWKCFYPPPNESNVATFVKKQKVPSSSWKKYEIEIIKRAEDYNQGLRRLKLAYSKAHIDSTQNEDNSDMSAENGISDSENSDGSIDQMRKDDDIRSTIDTQVKTKVLRHKDSESKTSRDNESDNDFEDRDNGKRRYKRKRSESVHQISNSCDNDVLQLHVKMDQLHDDIVKVYRKLSKGIKGTKNSILYDLNKKVDAIKNTIAINAASVSGEDLKNYKENLGIQLPITTYDEFIKFDTMVKENNDKSTALRAIMANHLGSATQLKEAVRQILGKITTKAVQELYSAAGRKGPNGVTKNNFSATHTYSCMTDVIKDRIEKADEKAILSATSRYLSGAGDREGGKAIRDARKQQLPL
ncbi:uncharacterized protein [Temnothorax nylanderi]|uniref:uncharacterized protein n=1 Tax=Temnothorax nylanderi TaxID=102681 RepID=UPI003A84BD5E